MLQGLLAETTFRSEAVMVIRRKKAYTNLIGYRISRSLEGDGAGPSDIFATQSIKEKRL